MTFDIQKFLSKLQPCSIDGVEILVEAITTTGGQKTVIHEYPNSNKRAVESLGEFLEIYNVTAWLHGDDYFEQKQRLTSSLKKSGILPFTHPYLGQKNVSVDGNYSYTETDASLGLTSVTFTIVEAEAQIIPEADKQTAADVKAKKDATDTALEESFGERFLAATSSAYQKSLSTINGATNFINKQKSKVTQIVDKVSQVNATIENFTNSITSLINTPTQLGIEIIGVFDSLDTLYNSPQERFDAMVGFFNTGDDDTGFLQLTPQRIQEATNQKAVNNTYKLASLSRAYTAAADIEFATVEQINAIQQILEKQYQAVIGSYDLLDAADSGLTADALVAFAELRDTARLFFDQQRLTASELATIKVNTQPMQVLAYSLYGSTANTEKLIDINDSRDVSFVSGQVSVLT